MFYIQISDIGNTIDAYINNLELYWLEKNKTIQLYARDFKREKSENDLDDDIYTFTFSTFTNGNFEVNVNWKTNIENTCCKLKFVQVLNSERHELYKMITNETKSVYIHNIPYKSTFGVEDDLLKIRDEMEQNKLEWIQNVREFISEKHFLQKQNRYSEKMFWNIYWYQLHILTVQYPETPTEEDKGEITKLVNAMQNGGIPCNICKQHFILWKQMYPIELYLNSREKLIQYFMNLHNDVNKRNGKKIFSRSEFNERFEHDNGSIFTKRQIGLFGLDIVDMFHKRELNMFPKSYIHLGTNKIRRYVLTIPNFKSMIV